MIKIIMKNVIVVKLNVIAVRDGDMWPGSA